jgi:DNA replication protein DnaC
MQHQALLENYLRLLKLQTFAQNYQSYAQDAMRTNLSYERYLLALCQAEAEQRESHRIERAIANAKFPVLKLVELDELGFFPFTKDGAQLLFQLCSDLNERVSVIVTTNLRFADWNSIFGESNTTRYPTL